MKLKQIICRHVWQYLSKPSYYTDVECVKCGKIDYIVNEKLPIFTKMAHRSTYCWCTECGNDLVRDSFISDVEGMVNYKCTRCGSGSKWDFTSAPIPLVIESKF